MKKRNTQTVGIKPEIHRKLRLYAMIKDCKIQHLVEDLIVEKIEQDRQTIQQNTAKFLM